MLFDTFAVQNQFHMSVCYIWTDDTKTDARM